MDPLLDNAPCGFLVVDDDGHVVMANKAMGLMLGTSAETLVGRHIDALMGVPSRVFYQTHVFPTLRLQGQVHEVYVSLRSADGTEIPVLLNARRRADAGRQVSDWAVMPMHQRDEYENEILKARRTAEAAARAREEFFALASHELRSPLGAIKNWASILASRPPDEATLKRGLHAIERNVSLQSKLIEDMMDYARSAVGKLRLDMAPVDLRAVLEGIVEGVAPGASAKSIELQCDFRLEKAPVLGDADRLQQVFWNIANNAVKFTGAGGSMRFTLDRVEGWIEAAIADTGKGISPEFLPFVFERFRQEEGRDPGKAGLGLGMAITRQLVELHAGTIAASSPGVGQGATFTVRLPGMEFQT